MSPNLTQYDWCPYKKGNLDTDTSQRKGNVKAGRMPSTSQATPEATRS